VIVLEYSPEMSSSRAEGSSPFLKPAIVGIDNSSAERRRKEAIAHDAMGACRRIASEAEQQRERRSTCNTVVGSRSDATDECWYGYALLLHGSPHAPLIRLQCCRSAAVTPALIVSRCTTHPPRRSGGATRFERSKLGGDGGRAAAPGRAQAHACKPIAG
jgi:hypothetical protein